MSFLKGLKDLVKWVIDDFKTDWITVKELATGTYKGKFRGEDLFKFDVKKILKDYWLWFLMIILAWCSGYFFATQRLQDACNTFILNEGLAKCTASSFAHQFQNLTLSNLSVKALPVFAVFPRKIYDKYCQYASKYF